MIISDLSYLEVVSEVPNILGGKVRIRTNEVAAKQNVKIKVTGEATISDVSPSISVVASNDDL